MTRTSARLRVTAELVRTSDDAALWSGTLDGNATDVAMVQDTIARAVFGKLGLQPPGQRSTGPGARGTRDAVAYDLFLRGRYADERFEYPRAESLYNDALKRDPRFARALGRLAIVYSNSPIVGVTAVDSVVALANSTAQRALVIDSTVVEPYIAQSNVLAGEWRLGDAIKPLEKAISFDSSDAEVRSIYAFALAQIGRVEEAVAQGRRGRDADPLSPQANGIYGYVLGASRRFDEAIALTKTSIALGPNDALPFKQLGYLYAFTGMRDSAVAALERAVKIDSVAFGGRSALVFAYALAGRWDDVDRQRALATHDGGSGTRNYHAIIEHLVYGENDAAMASLERAAAEHDQLLAAMSIPCDALFDPLKANPRFDVLMHRIGAKACPATVKWPIVPPFRRSR